MEETGVILAVERNRHIHFMRILHQLKRIFSREAGVSAAWVQAQRQRELRSVHFEGQVWAWPIDKVRNEAGLFNRHRLRRRA